MKIEYLKKMIDKYLQEFGEGGELYHYTSIHGLEGIISKREFWVSHSDFLNDKTELKYTLHLFSKILSKKMKEINVSSSIIQGYFIEYFKGLFEQYPTYILSLSTNGDSNLLWSNYSHNEGYNIAFDFNNILEDLKPANETDETVVGVFASKVIYDREIHIKAISKIVDDLIPIGLEAFAEFEKVKGPRFFHSFIPRETINQIFLTLQLFSAFFKDQCFQQEEEYRVVFLVPHKINNYKCRISNGVFIPYIKVEFSDECIAGLTVGPKNKMDISEEGLKSFLSLHNFNLDLLGIKQSKIPYRY
ncbi:DUF2971 domain-containing protein [Bacillus subtilis]|uniref:DUF2971 domain-containing protein n=1 Tax=Bacillus subtilis TaxID=1423 RepID=UPI0023EB0CCD|nr:DUF2971 domain-containing protein [Bacillus subtilis]MDF4197798.1 DUF2971 domain-containing protein [Bacillus subtilis]MDF4215527.1 DUF2971 domain-containing protein [Bacillus subtilis]